MDAGRAGDPEMVTSAAEQLPFILIVCEGPDLRLAYVNAATRALIPGRETLGRPLGEVFPDVGGQQWIDLYAEVLHSGVPMRGVEWRATLTRPDGSVHEIYTTFSISPWRHADGSVRGVIGAGFDVTPMVQARLDAESRADHMQERYEKTLDVVTALQRELLPRGLPVLPGAQIGASYLLADTDRAAGGDWFEAVAREDGTVALVVGDVVGHGVAASGVMGQLRAVLQDRLAGGADVAEALDAADRFARRNPAAHAATVCLAVLDPRSGDVAYCTAGHPPPLLIRAGGDTRYLSPSGAAPLGTGSGFAVCEERLEIGDLLLLHSDGILERPGLTVPAGRAELARVAASAAIGQALHAPHDTAAERVCSQTVELLVRISGHSDDITLLAAQRVPPPPELTLELPAELSSLRASRAAVTDWLAAAGATDDDAFVLQHALSELVTNAIEHGYEGRTGGPVRMTVRLDPGGEVVAEVRDQGTWREPARKSLRGRGLALTAQLVGDLRVEPGPAGTVATLRHMLTRPARKPGAGRRPDGRPGRAEPMRLEEAGPDEVRVTGPVDATTATHLRQDLLRRSRGGALPLAVDLTGVTVLASAGVSALHQVAERHRRQGAPLDLHAGRGSAAQLVLDLVALPHRITQAGHTAPR
ncbi:SpoIIE family protein phosphatase [Nucisporomicrobium flavum]|uniref:SpoIIE family protein phosphatase n=1 Tax=Nucisporomicrobium flavum TaxID=2785915 RepID=UPI0018F677A2|nr:SpoIIE family protein phosphatase [Nucisporomicrobium flavum]